MKSKKPYVISCYVNGNLIHKLHYAHTKLNAVEFAIDYFNIKNALGDNLRVSDVDDYKASFILSLEKV